VKPLQAASVGFMGVACAAALCIGAQSSAASFTDTRTAGVRITFDIPNEPEPKPSSPGNSGNAGRPDSPGNSGGSNGQGANPNPGNSGGGRPESPGNSGTAPGRQPSNSAPSVSAVVPPHAPATLQEADATVIELPTEILPQPQPTESEPPSEISTPQ